MPPLQLFGTRLQSALCFSAGEGAEFRLRFGAKMSEFAGEPLDADVIVKRTVRDAVQSFGQSVVPLGDAVWIEVAGSTSF